MKLRAGSGRSEYPPNAFLCHTRQAQQSWFPRTPFLAKFRAADRPTTIILREMNSHRAHWGGSI